MNAKTNKLCYVLPLTLVLLLMSGPRIGVVSIAQADNEELTGMIHLNGATISFEDTDKTGQDDTVDDTGAGTAEKSNKKETIKVTLPSGKTTNPVKVSLPNNQDGQSPIVHISDTVTDNSWPQWMTEYQAVLWDVSLVDSYIDLSYERNIYFRDDGFSFLKYFLYDVDKDGVPELFLQSSVDLFAVLTYDDSLKGLGFNSYEFINEETGEIIVHGHWHGAGGSGEYEWQIYKIQHLPTQLNQEYIDKMGDQYSVYNAATSKYEDDKAKYNDIYNRSVKGSTPISSFSLYDINDSSGLQEWNASPQNGSGASVLDTLLDVDETDWYAKYVISAYDRGLMNGVSLQLFDPDGTLTVAQAITMGTRLHSTYYGLQPELGDDDPWYSREVEYATANGLIQPDEFRDYDTPITRRAFDGILSQAIRDEDALPELNNVKTIPDVPSDTQYADAIYRLYRAGVLSGSDATGTFQPNRSITRAEAATILVRMADEETRVSFELTPSAQAAERQEDFASSKGFQRTLPKTNRSAAPDKNAPVTAQNLLALLKAYDPDGAWILEKSAEIGFSDPLFWLFGAETIGETETELGSAVHEECHIYAHSLLNGGGRFKKYYNGESTTMWGGSENIYIGNGEYITISFTDVFDSKEMADVIPEKFRSVRFETYIGSFAMSLLGSRQYGVYGLLDEFAAYCWGFNNEVVMKEYFDPENSGGEKQIGSTTVWSESDGYLPWAEFRYYILSYMLYAKEHYPDVYEGLLSNTDFRKAFTTIDNIFGGLVSEYRAGLTRTSGFESQFLELMSEVEQPAYQEMLQLMKN